MKTTIFTIFVALFLSFHAEALEPVIQHTLTNPCTPSVNIVAIPGTYGCYSFTADNGIPNDPDSYYSWDFGDNNTATGKTVYHCYSPVTNVVNYSVSLTYLSPALCGVMPNTQSFILVVSPPASGYCVNPTPSVTVNGYSVTVYAGSAIPEIMFKYYYGDGFSSQMDNSHTYSNCGNYIITVKNWDMNQPDDTCYAYKAINISCDGSTGIKENAFDQQRLFPNPVTERLYFIVQEPIREITVNDIAGRKCYRKEYESAMAKGGIELSGLTPGLYVLTFNYENGKQQHMKFIKK